MITTRPRRRGKAERHVNYNNSYIISYLIKIYKPTCPHYVGLLQEKRGGNLRGRQLEEDKTSPARINLLTAGNFSVLTKSGVTTTSSITPTSVNGNI